VERNVLTNHLDTRATSIHKKSEILTKVKEDLLRIKESQLKPQ